MVRGSRREEARVLCYMVVQPSELPLLSVAHSAARRGKGPFACDQTLIFGNATTRQWAAHQAGMKIVVIDAMKQRDMESGGVGGTWGSSLNTQVFLDAWEWLADSEYFSTLNDTAADMLPREDMQYEWIVKIDPDTCFMPSRLRPLMLGHDGFSRSITLAQNIASWWVPGPLEILSWKAMNCFLGHLEPCKNKRDPSTIGEDTWLGKCLSEFCELVFVPSDTLLLWHKAWGFNSLDANKDYVARHPRKTVESLYSCYHHQAQRAPARGEPPQAASS